MKNMLMLATALACLPGRGSAQTNVADPAVPVPAVVYQSVFGHLPTGVEMESVDWKAANAEVGQFRNGHIDILKWEEALARQKAAAPMPMQHGMPAPTPASAASPAATTHPPAGALSP